MLEINGLITITRHNKKDAVTAVTEINARPSRNDAEHAACTLVSRRYHSH